MVTVNFSVKLKKNPLCDSAHAIWFMWTERSLYILVKQVIQSFVLDAGYGFVR